MLPLEACGERNSKVCQRVRGFFSWTSRKPKKHSLRSRGVYILDAGSGVWEAWHRLRRRYPRMKEEGHCTALCAVTVGIAGRSGRTRGYEDIWKTSCVIRFGSGCQYRLWGRQRSISGIFRQPRVALTSRGCCDWTFCILHIYFYN